VAVRLESIRVSASFVPWLTAAKMLEAQNFEAAVVDGALPVG
jgi:hypothetical protein